MKNQSVNEQVFPIKASDSIRTAKEDTTGLQFMLPAGVACWALAGFLASLPAGSPSIATFSSALAQISQKFTDDLALGILAASLALIALTLGTLPLAKRDGNLYDPYERRTNLRRLALGFCWFNTGILGFAIISALVSSASSSNALELLSKSIGVEQIAASDDADAFTVQSGIGFLFTMVLLILLALNNTAEKLALAVVTPHRHLSYAAETSQRESEIDQLSNQASAVYDRIDRKMYSSRNLGVIISWLFAGAIFMSLATGIITTYAHNYSRSLQGLKPLDDFWGSVLSTCLIALFQYYFASLMAAPIKYKRWRNIAEQSKPRQASSFGIGSIVRGLSFVLVPLALQSVFFFSADYHDYWPQLFALLFCTWIIPSSFTMLNLSVGSLDSLVAWLVGDGFRSKIKYLSRIQAEERELHEKLAQNITEVDAEPQWVNKEIALKIGLTSIKISLRQSKKK